jgi:hypothetical protein
MELYDNCYEEQSIYCNEAIYDNDTNHIEQNDQFEEVIHTRFRPHRVL